MRKLIFAAAILFATGLAARAEEKEVTVTGEGVCAKCSLKEAKTCQNVIQVEEDGKTVKYYLAKNDVSNAYHKDSGICTGTVKTKVTGTVKEEEGKKTITATKIEKAE